MPLSPDNPAALGSLPLVWPVGALCRAVADTLSARFNPITVQGEISGFSRASSGHCYLSLKDSQGQIRCAMFRRAASLLDFTPRDGEQVQVRGSLGVYEQRGDLQLIIESMTRVGQGALFEQFLRLKAKLEAEGLFDASRKRAWPLLPRTIGLVTSLGAAALHDVMTALQRRAPHVKVVLAPAAVQGAQAPAELVKALHHLYHYGATSLLTNTLDGILIVRGGGSLEDLWAFNDEELVRTIAISPVPVMAGIGHETDFSLVDFVADIRAPTPTAAAEMVTQDREVWLSTLAMMQAKLLSAAMRPIDNQYQRLDSLTARLGRPNALAARQQIRLQGLAQRLAHSVLSDVRQKRSLLTHQEAQISRLWAGYFSQSNQKLTQLAQRLSLLDPQLVLQRGYAWVTDAQGTPVTQTGQAAVGQALQVHLSNGTLGVTVMKRTEEEYLPTIR